MARTSLKSMWSDYGVGALITLIIAAYVVFMISQYLTARGKSGNEYLGARMNPAYTGPSPNANTTDSVGPRPSNPEGQPAYFEHVPSNGSGSSITNSAELLPKKSNDEWSKLNPSTQGDLGNINLLKAGYQIGIDTVGQTLRNANLQIRSEPPNPQTYSGPWNMSTIEPDFMRPPMEIGQGIQ